MLKNQQVLFLSISEFWLVIYVNVSKMYTPAVYFVEIISFDAIHLVTKKPHQR